MSYLNEGLDQRAEVVASDGLTLTDSVAYWPRVDGAVAVTSSAFVTVLDQAQGVLVARAASFPDSNGQLSVSRSWPIATFPIGEDYCLLWEYAAGGLQYADRQYFDVVRNKLPLLVTESHLLAQYPDLNSHLAGIGETGPGKFIRNAWSILLDRIRAGGNRPSLILDKARLVNPGAQLALALVCQALSRVPEDRWAVRARYHEKLHDQLFAGLGTLKYDRNEDRVADSDDTRRLDRRKMSV